MRAKGRNRARGRRFELEVLATIREFGFDGELRYGQEELGGELGDIESDLGNIECKRRKRIASELVPLPNVRGVAVRIDRGPLLAVLRFRDWLSLERTARDYLRQLDETDGFEERDAPATGENGQGPA